MTISVRPATEADVAPICAVGRSAWPKTYAFAGREYVEHGLATWWTDEAVPAARGAVGIEYIDGNDRAAAVYARRGFVEVRRDPADQPGWPDQVWAELTLPATSTPS